MAPVLSSAPWGAATATPPPPRQTDTALRRRTSPAGTKCKFTQTPSPSALYCVSLTHLGKKKKEKEKLARNLIIFSTFREAPHGMFRQITVPACACALHTCTMASVKVGSAPPGGSARCESRRVDGGIQRTKSAPSNNRTTFSRVIRRCLLLVVHPQEVC